MSSSFLENSSYGFTVQAVKTPVKGAGCFLTGASWKGKQPEGSFPICWYAQGPDEPATAA
jgi:hypothetical protein